jgi:hypothetical protein
LGEDIIVKIIRVSILFVVMIVSYILISHLFKIEYLEDLKEKFEAKLKRKNNAA